MQFTSTGTRTGCSKLSGTQLRHGPQFFRESVTLLREQAHSQLRFLSPLPFCGQRRIPGAGGGSYPQLQHHNMEGKGEDEVRAMLRTLVALEPTSPATARAAVILVSSSALSWRSC